MFLPPVQLRIFEPDVFMSGNLREFPGDSVALRRLFFTAFLVGKEFYKNLARIPRSLLRGDLLMRMKIT